MNPDARMRDVIVDLLERAQMPQPEVARRTALATDLDYWRRLAPDLSIGSFAPFDALPPAPPLADADLRAAIAQFHEDGYFQTPPLLASRRAGGAECPFRSGESDHATVTWGDRRRVEAM